MNSRILWLRIAAISGTLVIILGAFGAHGLEEILSEDMKTIFETAVKYHFYHTLALLAVIAMCKTELMPKPMPAICLTWLIGIFIFSGSLYLLSITGMRWLGAITPIGGVAMIVGWVWLALSAKRILSNEL